MYKPYLDTTDTSFNYGSANDIMTSTPKSSSNSGRINPLDKTFKTEAENNNPLNYKSNVDYELGLGNPKLSNTVDDAKYIMNYTYKTFDSTRTTSYLNENKDRLWFWNNVGFVFAIGKVLEDEDKIVLDEILKSFDKTESTFLPNVYKIYMYNDPIIKRLEQMYNIDNGNYHFMLIPFVSTDDPNILIDGPESAYQKHGAVDVFVEPQKVVSYMCEVNYKYGAIRSLLTDTISNQLNVPETSKENDRYYHHTYRVINPSSSNPMEHRPMRMERKGYFDSNAEDNFELINPEQDISKYAPQRQYFTPGDLTWNAQGESISTNENQYYRRPAKMISRESTTDTNGPTLTKRTNTKQSLWNQIHNKDSSIIPASYIDTTTKGAIMKVNTMYESETHMDENPNYQIYDEPIHAEIVESENDNLNKSDIIDSNINIDDKIRKIRYINDSATGRYVDNISKREDIPIWNQQAVLKAMNGQQYIQMPAEQKGIFAQSQIDLNFK